MFAEESAAPGKFWREFFSRPSDGVQAPGNDPHRAAKIALGELLFKDARLSGDGSMSCATCHQPERAFTDGLAKPQSRLGGALRRNAPALLNLAWATRFNRDGSAESLEQQARAPITRKEEMAGSFDEIISKLKADKRIVALFKRAFPTEELSDDAILKALAAYVRTLVSPRIRFDAWIDGGKSALNEAEVAGFRLFVGKAGCVACHAGWRFTDDGFHDIGVNSDDPGRSGVPGGAAGIPAFKTPGLRQLQLTAPYMHDGSLQTLENVIDHYAGSFKERPSLSSNMVRDLVLTEDEKSALLAFLRSLSTDPPTTQD
ncbi:MAG: cytochrome-c peroxidase [Hyphomicrobiales bacterium]